MTTKPARGMTCYFVTPCLQLTNSDDQDDAQLMRLMEPNSTIGPRLSERAMVFESLHGLDMLAPSTADPKLTVWVTLCLAKELLCRQQGFVGTTKQGETLETLAGTLAGTTTSTHAGIHPFLPEARRDSSRSGEQGQIVHLIPCSRHTVTVTKSRFCHEDRVHPKTQAAVPEKMVHVLGQRARQSSHEQCQRSLYVHK